MKRSHRSWKVVGGAVIGIAALTLAGCSSGGSGSATDSKKTTVGFSTAALDNPFTAGLVQSVVNQAKAAGLNMLPPVNAAGDSAKQITDFESLISQNVDGIVLIPRDSDAIVPAVKEANAAHIPVVTVDTAANGGDVYMQIRADNVSMGTSACEQLGPLVKGQGTVLEISGYLATSNGVDRSKGFQDCMKKKYPNVKIVSQDAEWNAQKASDIAQSVLSTQKIDGVYLASDSTYLVSVKSVMTGIGDWIPAGQSGHVPMVTIDGGSDSLAGIRGGFVDAVVSQPVDQYGVWGTKYLLDALAGKKFTTGPTDHNSVIVDYDGTLADMLPSPVVTKKNVDDKSLWGNFK